MADNPTEANLDFHPEPVASQRASEVLRRLLATPPAPRKSIPKERQAKKS
ncbi:MAG: hypothetical protein V4574_12000 [Pseudomonadota bacterium]